MTEQRRWLRLAEYAESLNDTEGDNTRRDHATALISRARLTHAEEGDGPLVRFPERPKLEFGFIGRRWLLHPALDFDRSTIIAPCLEFGGPRMQPVIIEALVNESRQRSTTHPRKTAHQQEIVKPKLASLYPGGVPPKSELTDAALYAAVMAVFPKGTRISKDTVLRAAGRRKRK